jgi:hypothetical protein
MSCAVNEEHHITIAKHDSLRDGTLATNLTSVDAHHAVTRDEILRRLFD